MSAKVCAERADRSLGFGANESCVTIPPLFATTSITPFATFYAAGEPSSFGHRVDGSATASPAASVTSDALTMPTATTRQT